MTCETNPNQRGSLAINDSLDRAEDRHSTAIKNFSGDAGNLAEKSNRLRSNPTEVSSSFTMTPLSVETAAPNPNYPDGQTPAPDPSSPTRNPRDGKIRPSLPSIFAWMSNKVHRILDWIRTPTGWTLGLTFFSVVFAISFGVFTIMAWAVAIKANQKADLAILIAKYQYKLDEYNTNLTIFATRLAIQARDDGRLSNQLQYYALCMSNSTLFPGLCERLIPGSDGSREVFAMNFNNTFPFETGASPDPTAPTDDPLSEPPKLWNEALSNRLFDDLRDDKGKRLLAASRVNDIIPALVTIPAILMLAVMLTVAIH